MKVASLTLTALCLFALCTLSPAHAQSVLAPGGALAQQASSALSFGPLRLGMSEDEVERLVGAPAERYEAEIDEVSGQQTHATGYPNGVTLAFWDNPDVAAPGTLLAIIVDGACEWEAVGGLKLGMEASKARAIMADLLDQGGKPDEAPDELEASVLLAGTQTVLQTRFQGGKVVSIYFGPSMVP